MKIKTLIAGGSIDIKEMSLVTFVPDAFIENDVEQGYLIMDETQEEHTINLTEEAKEMVNQWFLKFQTPFIVLEGKFSTESIMLTFCYFLGVPFPRITQIAYLCGRDSGHIYRSLVEYSLLPNAIKVQKSTLH